MSASPMARQAYSGSQTIPTRKILITDPSQMPDIYSSTPGGTLYSTTPGGTRLIYDRSFMLNLKSSPLSQTPPKNLPTCLLRGSPRNTPFIKGPSPVSKSSISQHIDDTQEQFVLDL